MYSFFADRSVFANIGLQNDDIAFYDLTDSTNTRAREAFLKLGKKAPKLFVADRQSAGRGTRGRSFESGEGGLYFSLLYIPQSPEYDASCVTPIAAAAVFDAVKSLLGDGDNGKILIKWVNDVYIENKKIAGILCEKAAAPEGVGYIIGIGINVTGSNFSPSVSSIAASIEKMTGKTLEKEQLLYEILKRLIPSLKSPRDSHLANVYRQHTLPVGTAVFVTDSLGNTREAGVIGLDRNFHLLVRYGNGETAELISGDVSIKF